MAHLLSIDGKQKEIPVHKLVLAAFVGPRPEGEVCRHKDGTRTNNRSDNLEYGTQAENLADAKRHGTLRRGESMHTSKLTNAAVVEILRRRAEGEARIDLAREYGVHPSTITTVCRRKTWQHVDGSTESHKLGPAVGERHPCAVLTADDVRRIRDMGRAGMHYTEIAGRFGVGGTAVWKILHGTAWKSVEVENGPVH